MVWFLAFIIFAVSSWAKEGKLEREKELVKVFFSKVLYNTDYRTCLSLLEKHVIFKPFPNGEIMPSKEQVKSLCKQMQKKPVRLNFKDVKVELASKNRSEKLAIVYFMDKDGRIILQRSVLVRLSGGRIRIIW